MLDRVLTKYQGSSITGHKRRIIVSAWRLGNLGSRDCYDRAGSPGGKDAVVWRFNGKRRHYKAINRWTKLGQVFSRIRKTLRGFARSHRVSIALSNASPAFSPFTLYRTPRAPRFLFLRSPSFARATAVPVITTCSNGSRRAVRTWRIRRII